MFYLVIPSVSAGSNLNAFFHLVRATKKVTANFLDSLRLDVVKAYDKQGGVDDAQT